jgi:hypothetical protein
LVGDGHGLFDGILHSTGECRSYSRDVNYNQNCKFRNGRFYTHICGLFRTFIKNGTKSSLYIAYNIRRRMTMCVCYLPICVCYAILTRQHISSTYGGDNSTFETVLLKDKDITYLIVLTEKGGNELKVYKG